MSDLAEYLALYLRTQVSRVLAGTPDQEVRPIFRGPPEPIMEQVLERLGGSTGLSLPVSGQVLHVPVYLVADQAEGLLGLSSGRCTDDHLVKVRNYNSCRCFVALVPPGVSINESITTSAMYLGASPVAETEGQAWVRQPFMAQLLDEGLRRLQLPLSMADAARSVVEQAILDAAEMDIGRQDRRSEWEVVHRLFELPSGSRLGVSALLAVLGFPPCDPAELGNGVHCKIVRRIAEHLEQVGISPAFDAWIERAPDSLQLALEEARGFIRQTCYSPSDFAKAPSVYYRLPPEVALANALPSWWTSLTLAEWNELLDSDGKDESKNGLAVESDGTVLDGVRGLPSIFQDRCAFQLTLDPAIVAPPVHVRVARSKGGRVFEPLAEFDMTDRQYSWCDESPPDHDRLLRYRFEVQGCKPCTVQVLSMDHYGPGIVVYCRNGTKHFLFKRVTQKKAGGTELFECDLELPGVGSHHLDILHGRQIKVGSEIIGYETTAELGGAEKHPVNKSSDTIAVCLIETDEESVHEFQASLGGSITRQYRVYVRAADAQPIGASSEFDRLILEHRSTTKRATGSARVEPVSCRAADLEHWILEDRDSLYPLILGDDYLEAWTKPVWNQRPVLSGIPLQLDPRPDPSEFVVPENFRAAREKLQLLLRDGADASEDLLEVVSLGERMRDPEFRDVICKLLEAYGTWLRQDYEACAWVDVIAVHRCDPTGTALESYPHAVMLSPLHPIRLGWQCVAQALLQDAIDHRSRCPAASILDPRVAPDCLLLPCRTPAGRCEPKLFLSVASSSDYWGVLWNSTALGDLNEGGSPSIFNSQLGITIDGLATGFSVAQVERAIDEIAQICAAKSTLRVSVASDTRGSSSSNQGISTWGQNSLGEQDAWQGAGMRTLEVYDSRTDDLQPEDAVLATMTQEVGAAIKWFSRRREGSPCDLAIVAHLGTQNPELSKQSLRSPIDALGLNRFRIRKQLAASSGRFIAESRVGKHRASADVTETNPESVQTAASLLSDAIGSLEDQCAEAFDSYVFAPKMPTLDAALAGARYCAVSSTNIDPACFFNAGERSYLWDYDLPSYSRRAGENNGFYLIASESPTMLQAAKGAIRVLNPAAPDMSDSSISVLLREISRRGVPTLKRLTCGGGSSLGEIGVLVCLRALQCEFSQGEVWPTLFPTAQPEASCINLLVPIDPFRAFFDELRDALEVNDHDRPDLLAISIRIEHGQPAALKVTPIEVKARIGVMSDAQLQEAIGQARVFADFLQQLLSRAAQDPIWGVACRHLVSSWLDYAFRVYGQLQGLMSLPDWTRWHAEAVGQVLAGELVPTVDCRGRLFVVDASAASKHRDLDGDGLREVVTVNLRDAHTILLSPRDSVLPSLCEKLGDWSLQASQSSSISQEHPPEVEPVAARASATSEGVIGSTPVAVVPKPPVPVPAVEAACSGLRFAVGTTADTFDVQPRFFYPSNTALNQLNIGIVGDLGVGKTQLVQSLLYQLRSQPEANRAHRPCVLILDYKRDYSKPGFVSATGARVIKPENIPLNLFDTRGSEGTLKPWLHRARCFIDILSRIYPGIGPVQQERLKKAIKHSYDDAAANGHVAPTIYDVFDAYGRLVGDKPDAPYSIMSNMVDMELFTREQASVLPFGELLTGVVVLDLGPLEDDDKTKNMIVAIFLNLFYAYMLRIEKKPFLGVDPQLRFIDSFLLVDEANNIMQYEFDVLKKLLLQGREFGIGVILASQYLSHFKTQEEDYREPLLTWFVHKVPNLNVRELEGIGLTSVDQSLVDRIKALPNHHCLYKTFDVAGEVIRATPFYELLK